MIQRRAGKHHIEFRLPTMGSEVPDLRSYRNFGARGPTFRLLQAYRREVYAERPEAVSGEEDQVAPPPHPEVDQSGRPRPERDLEPDHRRQRFQSATSNLVSYVDAQFDIDEPPFETIAGIP
jgi:hypothetical protein